MQALYATSGTFALFPIIFVAAAILITFSLVNIPSSPGYSGLPRYGKAELMLLMAVFACVMTPHLIMREAPYWWTAVAFTIMAFMVASILAYLLYPQSKQLLRRVPRHTYFLLASLGSLSAWVSLLQHSVEAALGIEQQYVFLQLF